MEYHNNFALFDEIARAALRVGFRLVETMLYGFKCPFCGFVLNVLFYEQYVAFCHGTFTACVSKPRCVEQFAAALSRHLGRHDLKKELKDRKAVSDSFAESLEITEKCYICKTCKCWVVGDDNGHQEGKCPTEVYTRYFLDCPRYFLPVTADTMIATPNIYAAAKKNLYRCMICLELLIIPDERTAFKHTTEHIGKHLAYWKAIHPNKKTPPGSIAGRVFLVNEGPRTMIFNLAKKMESNPQRFEPYCGEYPTYKVEFPEDQEKIKVSRPGVAPWTSLLDKSLEFLSSGRASQARGETHFGDCQYHKTASLCIQIHNQVFHASPDVIPVKSEDCAGRDKFVCLACGKFVVADNYNGEPNYSEMESLQSHIMPRGQRNATKAKHSCIYQLCTTHTAEGRKIRREIAIAMFLPGDSIFNLCDATREIRATIIANLRFVKMNRPARK